MRQLRVTSRFPLKKLMKLHNNNSFFFYNTFALDSPSFPTLRSRKDTYVDKTDAIAELLSSDEGMYRTTRIFFARPRKFGKSLTLDVAAEMLSAGALPHGVTPWPGYIPVDVDALFSGLDVYNRYRRQDQTLRGLLDRSHFVIKLDLGVAQSGVDLKAAIYDGLSNIAYTSFGNLVEAKVRAAGTPGGAISVLISAVPLGVPIALFVDEYDTAIIQDVSESNWDSAKLGIKTLRSLLMSTKASGIGNRIEKCIVTGVARFTHTSFFSGANNFVDFTDSPIISRAIGFSEEEIRTVYPAELQRLARNLHKNVDGAIAELARWYNGYCFDGKTSCFNPFPVLLALRTGNISEKEMEAASGTNWLSLTPDAIVNGLAKEMVQFNQISLLKIDIADLEAKRIGVVPLLLQTGLLSLVVGKPSTVCSAPNEYARQSLQKMVSTALLTKQSTLMSMTNALQSRDRVAFSTEVKLLFERLPRTLFKRDSGGIVGPREAVYHAALFSALKSTAPHGIDVQIQVFSLRGIADIIIKFAADQMNPAVAWVFEIGVGNNCTTASKLIQAQEYAIALNEPTVYCCGIVVKSLSSLTRINGSNKVIEIEWSSKKV
jgi:hypothetical protein